MSVPLAFARFREELVHRDRVLFLFLCRKYSLAVVQKISSADTEKILEACFQYVD